MCSCIERGGRRRVYCQGANIGIGQAGVSRVPGPTSISAFEHAAAICHGIECGRRRRVYRQGYDWSAFRPMAGPDIGPSGNGKRLAEAYQES